jgi:hypothetical protein
MLYLGGAISESPCPWGMMREDSRGALPFYGLGRAVSLREEETYSMFPTLDGKKMNSS